MSGIEKLKERFKLLPKDFTFDETKRLLNSLGYQLHNKGKTSGSRVRFFNEKTKSYIDFHKPHPGSIMKAGIMKAIHKHLTDNKLI